MGGVNQDFRNESYDCSSFIIRNPSCCAICDSDIYDSLALDRQGFPARSSEVPESFPTRVFHVHPYYSRKYLEYL